MTTIPPPNAFPPGLASTAGAGAAAPTVVVLTQAPSGVQAASPGTVIAGTVIAVDSQGQAVLQTDAGTVTIQGGAAALSVGQQVRLQIQAGGTTGPLQAFVLSAETTATADLLSAGIAAPSAEAAAADAMSPAATVAPSVAAGSVVIATVIGPAAAAMVAAAQPRSTTSPSRAPPQPPPAATGIAAPARSPAADSTSPGAPQAASSATGDAVPAARAAAPSPTPAAPLLTGAPAAVADVAAPSGPPAAPAPVEPSPTNAPPASPSPAAAPAPEEPPAAATPAPRSPGVVSPAGTLVRPMSSAIASYTASTSAASPAAAEASPPPLATTTPAITTALPTPPAGTQVPLRLVGPVTSLASAAAGAATGQVVATVVAQTSGGQTIVDTAIGRLAFAAPATADLALGAQIAFEIASPAIRSGAYASSSAPTAVPGRGVAGLAAAWPALKSALAALAQVDPPLAARVLETALARPDSASFLGQVLSWIGSPADDARALLGQAAADSLQQAGRGDVLSRLDGDLREMAKLNASASDWQVFYVPILDTTEARQLRVYTRRRKSETDRRRDGGGRFVVEVEFEGMGPLQLDGLVQKPRIDLILRSHVELADRLRAGIADVFGQTCEAAGLQGKIFFQAIPAFPVSPLDEMTKSPTGGLSV